MRLKQSSMTTSSSLPSISDILFAIHLRGERAVRRGSVAHSLVGNSLFHDLQIDLLHVNLLIELRGEFGRLEQSRINLRCHGKRCLRYNGNAKTGIVPRRKKAGT